MIDTDKYEGHDNWEGTKVNMANEANKLLIADAPLLLEEVKRLREGIKSLAENIHDDMRGKYMIDALMELIE